MSVQPTASKTDLFLACQRPFAPDTETARDETGEAAQYGTDYHADMHRLQRGEEPTTRAAAHATMGWAYVKQWAKENGWPIRTARAEQPLAWQVTKYGKRHAVEVDFDADSHTYALPGPRWIGGTADLVLNKYTPDGMRRLVIDYKTGFNGDFGRPWGLGQMRTLATMVRATDVAILHHPRGILPLMYHDEIPENGVVDHHKSLRRAILRVGDGNLRPGPHCHKCPAAISCPTRNADVIKAATHLSLAVVGNGSALTHAVDPGKAHQLLAELDKLIDRARKEIKSLVQSGAIVERPDGKTLRIETKSEERLSKSAIIKALGPQEAEKLFDMLRARGALTPVAREELHAR